MSEHSHVLWGMILTNTGFVFAKSDVQHPMQTVFDLLMFSNTVEKRLCRSIPTAYEKLEVSTISAALTFTLDGEFERFLKIGYSLQL